MRTFSNAMVFAVSFAIAGCTNAPVDDDTELPAIVEVFACGDYCPGPEEKYTKRVYDGIADEEECRKLGGRPYFYIGWGQHTVCEVR
ncbi:MAG: hypothetical protein QNK34_03965 [Woeseiaceae bacterium]|nr:hypothetical protein [Woeseiaceae bacterium]